MSHDGPWARRLRLLRVLLQRGEISTVQASRLLGIDRRRARADLEALEENGVPVTPLGENRERRWVLTEGWRHLGVHIGLQERLAMLFGRELVESFLADTDFGDALTQLETHFQALDPTGLNGDLRRRFHYVHEPKKDYAGHRETLDALVAAILGGYRVNFDYTSVTSGKLKPYKGIAPLTLAIYKRGVYLLFERRGEFRTFAVERLANLEPLPDVGFDYPLPSEYSPTRELAGRFGISSDGREAQKVVLRFAPEVQTFVESREWVPDQKTRVMEDGSVELSFHALGYEIGSFVMQFGHTVEVISPSHLRERVKDELTRALALYGD